MQLQLDIVPVLPVADKVVWDEAGDSGPLKQIAMKVPGITHLASVSLSSPSHRSNVPQVMGSMGQKGQNQGANFDLFEYGSPQQSIYPYVR